MEVFYRQGREILCLGDSVVYGEGVTQLSMVRVSGQTLVDVAGPASKCVGDDSSQCVGHQPWQLETGVSLSLFCAFAALCPCCSVPTVTRRRGQ